MNLWDFLKERMLMHTNQIICENNAALTFEDMIIWAELFAKKIKGIKCCAILCSSEMAASMALLSCFAGKVTAVPLSMRYGELHCNKILDTINPDAIITDEDGQLCIRKISDGRYVQPKKPPALIMCTSGTTGKPKGVMLSEESILTNVRDIAEYFAIGSDDTILISRPIYHCAVLTGEFLTALVKGAKIRFYSGAFNPMQMLEMINEYDITAFCSTPTMLRMMAKFKRKIKNETLKHICISGECMDQETGLRIAETFPQCKIYHVYGLTEACPRVSYLPPELFRQFSDCVGFPLKSVRLKIIDKDFLPAAVDREGILWVKGENVMLGYYGEPEKTEEVLQNGWLCTGDVAVINSSGLLKIKGRNDHLIIKSGMNIYPAEIEAAVKLDPRVREVMVYGFENRHGTQIGMKIAGDFSCEEEVKKLCAECLPSFQVPTVIEIVAQLPKNASGKIIRGEKYARI